MEVLNTTMFHTLQTVSRSGKVFQKKANPKGTDMASMLLLQL